MPAKTPSSPTAEGPLVFQAVILPLLEEKCTKCHNADKDKGDLRLDNYEVVMKGGETEGNIVPGDPDKSLSMIRLLLPEDDDEHMPPEGKPQFTDEDIALFRWWIENGASDTMTVKDQTPPPGTEARLQELMKGASARIDPSSGASRAWRMVSPAGLRRLALAAVAAAGMAATTPAAEPEAAVQQAIKAVETSGATLLPVSAEGTAYRFTALNVAKTFKDDGLKPLVPIADRIQSLDLARTQVTDAGLAAVAAMSQLKELRLDNTGITDAGLEHLKGLANLEYLNLYGSKVTDAGLQKLIGLKNLRSLYLWQTGVTKAGVAQLHGKLPGAYINIGWEESDNAQPTAVAAVAAAKPEAKPAAPAPGKPAAAVAAAAPLPATAVVFRDVVTPILADKCVSCHGPDKSKGKLKLDTYADIRKGGSDGDINVVPGKAAESLMVKRIHLPVDDDDHMPPEDKPQITAGELAVLEWWINQGASETQTLAQTKRDPKVDQAIAVVLAASKKAAPAVTKAPVKPAPAPAKPTPAPAKPAPAPAKPAAPAVASAKLDPAIAGKADVYQHIVAPILAEKCISCHGEEKGKGKLRLHTFADIMKGGGEGDVNVIPGKSGDSLMVQRILLPADDDDHMPPEDEPQTTDAELKLLRWWIDAGAPEKQALSAAKTTPEIDALIAARLKDGLPKAAASAVAEADQKPLVPPMSDAEKKALADVTMKMEALNATLMPLAQDTELLRLSVINATDKFGDKEIALLAPVAKYLVWLDLARSQVTDAGLASLAAMPNVERLHLENTKVTDAGVAKLSSLKRLGYLNLYGTKVTDKGIAPLAACAELKKLFVWQTGVTKAGAKALEGKVNGLVVNVGLSEEEIAKLTAPPPAPEKKEEAKPAPKPTAKPAAKPETKPAAKPEAKPAPQPTAKPQPKPETKPAAKPAPKPTAPPAKSNNPPPAKKQPAADTKPKAA
ncbi:MAG: hypothetical protein KDK99_13090 [Verrucomicrobiales bacterium]|nr:hypothetical protein [Verrucomicrobiales bacterium]